MIRSLDTTLYKQCWKIFFGFDPIPEELHSRFDVVTLIGLMLHGHFPSAHLPSLVKLIKKDGIFVFSVRDQFWDRDSTDFKDLGFRTEIEKMVTDGKL